MANDTTTARPRTLATVILTLALTAAMLSTPATADALSPTGEPIDVGVGFVILDGSDDPVIDQDRYHRPGLTAEMTTPDGLPVASWDAGERTMGTLSIGDPYSVVAAVPDGLELVSCLGYVLRYQISPMNWDQGAIFTVPTNEIDGDPDSTIDTLVHLVCATPTGQADGPFADVPADHPFAEEIGWMVDQGITQGFPNDTFRPTNTVTRQAAAAFLYRLAGEPSVSGSSGFSDVPADHAFADAITWMVGEDITQGFPNDTFRPTNTVTRQAVAAFLFRFTGQTSAG